MSECVEVEKLRQQLEPAWSGRKVVKFFAPTTSPNPRKYAKDGWSSFLDAVKGQEIHSLDRLGKHLLIFLGVKNTFWHIHLNSTGWWMPGNDLAKWASSTDPIHDNFLHSVNDKNVRVKMLLSDGQLWNYHDSRTWGSWWIKQGSTTRANPYFQELGPDWIYEPVAAFDALRSYQKSRRTVKDVLCDQRITAGLGNYMACEVAFRASIHPHSRWSALSERQRHDLATEAPLFVKECFEHDDHSHWMVFGREGEPCRRPHPVRFTPIRYVKDGSGARGSYFCPRCQELIQ